MRQSPSFLAAMLAAFLMAGCTEEIITAPEQTSSYRQDTTSSYANVPASNQGLYIDPTQSVATGSWSATGSTTPTTGLGVQAQVTSSQARGLIKKTFELTVQVTNRDGVERTGYLVATFKDSTGKSELAYRYVTLAPGSNQTLTISSTAPATSGSVVFKERFL